MQYYTATYISKSKITGDLTVLFRYMTPFRLVYFLQPATSFFRILMNTNRNALCQNPEDDSSNNY